MLGQGGFATAIGAQNCGKASFFDRKIQIFKNHNIRCAVKALIAEGKILRRNNLFHLLLHYGVHRPVAPQGRIKPDSLTGSPSSPAAVFPPKRLPKTTSEA